MCHVNIKISKMLLLLIEILTKPCIRNVTYFVILDVIVCKETSALLKPRGALRYRLSMAPSRLSSLSLASSTGFAASFPKILSVSEFLGRQDGLNLRLSMSPLFGTFHPCHKK